MRLLATLAAAATLVATPAYAITKTVYVPIARCHVTVTTNEVSLSANHRGLRIDRSGSNAVTSTC